MSQYLWIIPVLICILALLLMVLLSCLINVLHLDPLLLAVTIILYHGIYKALEKYHGTGKTCQNLTTLLNYYGTFEEMRHS